MAPLIEDGALYVYILKRAQRHGRPSRREMSLFLGKKFGPFGATSGESLAEFFCYRIPIGFVIVRKGGGVM